MSILMRCAPLAVFGCAVALLPACGSDCGEGTIRQGDECVAANYQCGAGTVLSGGQCVAVVDACGDGTSLDGTTCQLDDAAAQCGDGTQFDVMARRCVSTVATSCGVNTIEVDGVCVLAARLQIIHAISAANASVVDLYLDGVLLANDIGFRSAKRFVAVPAGAHSIGIALPDSGDAVGDPIPETGAVELAVAVGPVSDTVAVLTGTSTATFAAVTRQLPREIGATNLAFTFVHASPDAPSPIDLEHEGPDHASEADDLILADDIAYQASSSVVVMPASRFVFGLADGAGTDIVRYRASWENLGGKALTLVASGYVDPQDGEPGLTLMSFPAEGGAGTSLPLFD